MKSVKLVCHMGVAALISACGGKAPEQNSSLDGHYENATAAEMQAYIGKQTVVPEYAPVDKVIVGLPLLTRFSQETLVEEIFKAGVDQVLISHDSSYRGITVNSRNFALLADRLDGVQTRDSAGRLTERNRLFDIKLVEHDTRGLSSQDSGTVWARDWAPLGAVITDGPDAGKLRLVDFNYYADRQIDDFSSQAYAAVKSIERVSVPVYNEGGNFMNDDDGVCLMTERVVVANNARNAKAYLNDVVYNEAEIKEFYRDFAGCRGVTVFDRMPYEGTGHIDMWAKLMDNNTLMIGEIQEASMDTVSRVVVQNGQRMRVALPGMQVEFNAALEMQQFLEDQARLVEFEGVDVVNENGLKTKKFYNVVRIPMPVPSRVSDGSLVIRSYTNSLFVNGTAIIPQYVEGDGTRYPDQALRAGYEAEVSRVYRASGFNPVYVRSDNLIRRGGAVHCVTMQLPKL